MRNSFKNTWLSLCLLASAAMLGCGGGGGGGNGGNGGNANPVNPVVQLPNEAIAAQQVVTPIVQNANQFIPAVASYRYSTNNGNVTELSNNEIGNSVVNALEAPQFLRAVICAAGGNIEDGLWENESSGYSFSEVATYSNGVYERTVYTDNLDDIIRNGQNSYGESLEDSVVAYYKIDGCEADYDSKNKILKSLTIKPNAKIIVDERRGFYFHGKYNPPTSLSFKGTINTDLAVKWDGNIESFVSPKVFEISSSYNYYFPSTNGKDITNDYKNYEYGLQTSKKITSKTTYTFSKLEMDLTEISMLDNPYWNEPKEFKGNLKINIDGISGSVLVNKIIFVDCRTIQSNGNGWSWNNEKSPYYSDDAYDYDDETGV